MQCWQYYTSSKRDKSMWMAILQGWVGQGLAGRRRKTFKVWKMCSAVVGIRANPKLMLWAVSQYWVKPCLFWMLFCTFGWLPRWRWDKMTFAHEQTINTVRDGDLKAWFFRQHMNKYPSTTWEVKYFQTIKCPRSRVQSWVGQLALPVSRHESVLLTPSQLFHVSYKKPGREHKWIMMNLSPPLKTSPAWY